MDHDVSLAIYGALGFTFLICAIEVTYLSKGRILRSCCTGGFFLYLTVMCAGNTLTTLTAVVTVPAFTFGAPGVSNSPPTTDPAPVTRSSTSTRLAGLSWLWYAFLGVFAFEALLQRINVTLADKPVLTISNWITKARDIAEADAIKSRADHQTRSEQAVSKKIYNNLQITDAHLNTYVHTWLKTDPKGLEEAAAANHGDPRLAKALALAIGDLVRASRL